MVEPPFKKTKTWQVCWWPFWDAENVTLSNVNRDLQLGNQKVTGWIAWSVFLIYKSIFPCILKVKIKHVWNRHRVIIVFNLENDLEKRPILMLPFQW